jgi:uncharacterized protein
MRFVLSGLLALALIADSQAAFITQWNFNNSTLNPSMGAGTIATIGGVTSSFVSGTVNGGSSDPDSPNTAWNTASYPSQGTNNKLAGIEVKSSTFGFENIVISFDNRNSNTGSRYLQFQYSIDGTTFIDFGDLFDSNAGNTWFNQRQMDLSGISAVNNNANFAFRLVSAFAPNTTAYAPSNATSSYGTAGTIRYDMVSVQGSMIAGPSNAVPAPAGLVLALVALPGLGLLRIRARRS